MSTLRPILVTGAPRSGTTWVGRMLAEAAGLYYLYEPFNPTAGVGRPICDCRFERYFTYIHTENEADYLEGVRDMLAGRFRLHRALREVHSLSALRRAFSDACRFARYRRRGWVPLIKDPIALASAPWLAARFPIQVVVLIRHPAAFVSSMRRLGWPFDPTRWALGQPALMRDYLDPLRPELEDLAVRLKHTDLIEQAAVLWKTLHHLIAAYRQQHPEWIFVRHEDLSLDPVSGFRSLYAKLGLDFTERVQQVVQRYSGAGNPASARGAERTIRLDSRANVQSWKRKLTPQEVERIRELTAPIAEVFYEPSEW